MSKKLQGNGLWESSRMMLPQHKEMIQESKKDYSKKKKPDLDEQEIHQIEQLLAKSFRDHRSITIWLFDEYQNIELRGIVTVVQTYRREIKLAIGVDEWQWIKIDDIIVCL
ncbi:YolD-like family protein [Paenibacillus anaericanus]|uniref:YolD-like family protein n=1 Tax=Paenibacillus anaericanus TaxID=170367 RepID=A0A433XXB0_9BACL|nr:YolD-like family protein [Paenibacillus anaericanus]RUT39487.1 YolD-like family protein [Paenibacillus anaericanus]